MHKKSREVFISFIKYFYACIALVIVAQLHGCAHSSDNGNSMQLFDGVSLSGWQSLGEANWFVSDGALIAVGAGDGFLVSDVRYANYRLDLEFWIDETSNSGVFVVCADSKTINPDTCFEANIWDNHPNQQARTGAIVRRVMPPLAEVFTIGKWNSYQIIVSQNSVSCHVNGVLTAQLKQIDNAGGYIALQHFNVGEVRFRNIRLSPLSE